MRSDPQPIEPPQRQGLISRQRAYEDNEGRRERRARCRARVLLEAGESAQQIFGEEYEMDPTSVVTIRKMTALELGLAYVWMSKDEASPGATRWWTRAAVGIQQRWEEGEGLLDRELEAGCCEAEDDAERVVEQTAQATTRAVDGRQLSALLKLLKRKGFGINSQSTGTVVGAFVGGAPSPCGFAASKKGDPWTIDALGIQLEWQRRGAGRILAEHFIHGARAAGRQRCRVDSVPSAVAFWAKLAFLPVDAADEGCDEATRRLLRERYPNDQDQLMDLRFSV